MSSSRMDEYIERYSEYSFPKLRLCLASLEGRPVDDAIALEKAKAIQFVIDSKKHAVGANEERPEKPEADAPKGRSRFQEAEEYLAARYLSKAKNARERGLDFALTLSDMRKLLRRKRCAYTGVELRDDVPSDHPQKRTIDRIDASRGYLPENVVACSHVANKLKSRIFEGSGPGIEMTRQQLFRFAKAMMDHRVEKTK